MNEKVLKEKRKKLKETFDRVMRMIHEDDPESWGEFKRKEVEYEKRRLKRVQYYESVRQVEQVSIEDIPLPSANTDNKPPPLMPPPKVTISTPVSLSNVALPGKIDDLPDQPREKVPPGVPATMPPNLFKMRELDSDYESEKDDSEKEDEEMESNDKNVYEEFMKEVDSVQKKKEEEKTLDIRVDPTPEVELETTPAEIRKPQGIPEPIPTAAPLPKLPEMPLPLPPAPAPFGFPHQRMPHPHHPMFAPPPMRPMGLRVPPPPPVRSGMPPGPPPRHKFHQDRNMMMQQQQQQHKDPKSATITAKPQIRNLSADVTRFVPSSLKNKRDEPKRPKPKFNYQDHHRYAANTQHHQPKPTKDEAYNQFMNELKDLM